MTLRGGPPGIEVTVRLAGLSGRAWRPRRPEVARLVAAMAERAGSGAVEVSVLITDDDTIRRLNRKHRSIDRPTDVLAFPMEPVGARRPDSVRLRLLGDIVVSLDTCSRQARSRRERPADRLVHLLAHGLLHLLGWDHKTRRAFDGMEAETRRLVSLAVGTCGSPVENIPCRRVPRVRRPCEGPPTAARRRSVT